MLHALITAIVLAAQIPLVLAQTAQPPPAAKPAPSTRQQAIKALQNTEPSVRRAAVVQLGKVGTMADADLLVARLRDDDAAVRNFAEASLWQVWSRSGERAIDALFLRGVEQMEASHMPEALATFSGIIRKKPAFAEGWNKRATAHYLAGELDQSLADCDEVIKRNPQHFGALSGYGQIYMKKEEFEKAIDYFKRALAVNPNLGDLEVLIPRLEEALQERQRRMI
jgi:tetratricopeptide (TPR) repeat protein